MTGPSSPRGEHTPAPGITWEQHLVRTEIVVDAPEDTAMPGMNDPQPPRLNRATRRALARAKRKQQQR